MASNNNAIVPQRSKTFDLPSFFFHFSTNGEIFIIVGSDNLGGLRQGWKKFTCILSTKLPAIFIKAGSGRVFSQREHCDWLYRYYVVISWCSILIWNFKPALPTIFWKVWACSSIGRNNRGSSSRKWWDIAACRIYRLTFLIERIFFFFRNFLMFVSHENILVAARTFIISRCLPKT